MSDVCPVCRSPRIPGVDTCAQCGEPVGEEAPFVIETRWPEGSDVPDTDLDRRVAQAKRQQEHSRRMIEARSLEFAGDIEAAIAIYEALFLERASNNVPYKRLAILYRKAKRPADEERVVRAALGVVHQTATGWFVLRLAKILAEQKRAR